MLLMQSSAFMMLLQESPLTAELLAVIKGLRNGLVYGTKVRLPHSTIMTFLFRSDLSFKQKILIIVQMTKTHAINLGTFVFIYKFMLLLMKRTNKETMSKSWHSFIAGCIGGGLIFSQDNTVNNQIVLYLLSRVLTGLVKLASDKLSINREMIGRSAFALEATLVWGTVMWLFTHHRALLQPSLQSSMQYLYIDSDYWKDWWTLLIHNK